jgi:hypothetical protein
MQSDPVSTPDTQISETSTQPQMAVHMHEQTPVFNPISVAEHVEGEFTEYLLRRTKNGKAAISILEDGELIQVSSAKRNKDGTIYSQQHLMVKKEALLGVSHKKLDWLDKYRVGWWSMVAGGIGLSVVANPMGALLLAGGLFLSAWQIVDPELLVLETSTGKHPLYLNRMGSDRDLMKCSMDHLSNAMKSLLKTGELDCSGYEGAVKVLMAERALIIQNQAEAALETPASIIPQQPAVQEIQPTQPIAEEIAITPEETPVIPEVSEPIPEQVVEIPEPKGVSTNEPAPEAPPLELSEPIPPPEPSPGALPEPAPPPEPTPVALPEPAPPPEPAPMEFPEPAAPLEPTPVALPEPAPPPEFSATPTTPPPPAPPPPPGLAPMPLPSLPPLPSLGMDLPPIPPGAIESNLGLGSLAPPQALVAASPRQENLSTEDKDDLLSALGD